MLHTGGRQTPIHETVHPCPGQARALAAAFQRFVPVPGHLSPECLHGIGIARDSEVSEMTLHHATKPLPLFRDGLMSAALELDLDLL